jgi:IS5 family transposase
VVATPANVADSTVLPDLLHGNETRVWGDQAYRGQRAVIRRHAPRAWDFVNRRYRHRGVVDEGEAAPPVLGYRSARRPTSGSAEIGATPKYHWFPFFV